MSNQTIRCCQTALLVVAVLLLGAGMALGQPNVCPGGAPAVVGEHTTGLPTTKTCPPSTASGTAYTCTFSVTNEDVNHCVENLTFTETAPPGVNPVPVFCMQGATAVTLLAWNGAPGDAAHCTGTITVTPLPFNCDTVSHLFTDRIDSAGKDRGDFGAPCAITDTYCGLDSAGLASGTVHVTPSVCSASECNTPTCSTVTGCGTAPAFESLTCGTDTDSDNCTTPGCSAAGECVQAHVTTPCTARNECNTAACDATHACVQTARESLPCGTDTDGDICTTPGCSAAGECDQAHITDPTCGAEFCRTPGFWGTHGCLGGTSAGLGICEKSSSQNITQLILNEFGGTLSICGTIINNTDVGNVNSALEAICVSPKGDSRLQLARQLTAAALNCGITNSSGAPGACTVEGGATPCAGVSIGTVFDLCNAACPTTTTIVVNDINGTPTTLSCIGLLDCFNNGGGVGINPVTGLPECGAGPTCDENLVNGCFDFGTPGPAGSPKACNDARKNDVVVVPPLP